MVAKAAKLCFQMKTYVRLSKKKRTIPLIMMKAFRTEGRSQRAKRDAFRYLSSPQDPLCIISNVITFDWKTRKNVPTTMIDMRKEGQALNEAEQKLTERAKIHAVKDTKHEEATTRFAADVCYHKNCYPAFTGGAWHREENVEESDNKPDFPVIEIEQFFDLVENHIK